ncbi:type III secretion protein W [Pantoea alhagi]|uniref:type III secretion system gatekeeper subunit SctW n=1 Tax=Mixta sp. BE291 TaxID=3158787 RepID=UPI002855C6F6|nr:type III secretion protein W [Pantoea alhagi]
MTVQSNGAAPIARYTPPGAQEKRLESDSSASAYSTANQPVADEPNDVIIATAEKFLNSVDEMTAFITQIRNRRDLEKRADFFTDVGLDYVLDEQAHEKIDALIPLLKNEAKNNPGILLHYAREAFPDDSCLIAALRVLLRIRKFILDEVETISLALELAEEQAEPKPTKAGINIALKARLYSKKLKMSPVSVRRAYRDFIQSEDPELVIYEKWLAFYGAERRHILIDFIEKAVLTDLEASDPSCNDAEFGYLLSRLSHIKLIRSGDIVFIEGVNANSVLAQWNQSVDKWLFFLLSAIYEPDEIYQSIEEVGGDHLLAATEKEKVEFLQSIFIALSKVPEAIFLEAADREKLLENLRILISDITLHEVKKSQQEMLIENKARDGS